MNSYDEIKRLKCLLDEAEIPYVFRSLWGGYQIIVQIDKEITTVSIIQHSFSYGRNQDLLEMCGCLTEAEYEDDNVLGYLTADEVLIRVKYCYDHKTTVYKGADNSA